MKTITTLFVLVIIAFFSKAILSQPNYDNLKSVVQIPPSYHPPNVQPVPRYSVTADGFENFYLGVDFGEPYIATNPNNPLITVCAWNINNFYTTLDGYTWNKYTVPFPGFGVIGDPCVCFDSLGNLFYSQLYEQTSSGPWGIVVNKSTNMGLSWGTPVSVHQNTSGLQDKEWITADQTGGPFSNNLYVGWRDFDGIYGMMFTRSTDHGQTWSSPTVMMNGSQGAYVSVGPNGNIQGGSLYYACQGIYVFRSTDGGQTFGSAVLAVNPSPPGVPCAGRSTVKNCIRTDAMPRMAADNSYTSTRGNVYVVYATNPAGPDNADVNMVRSTDYGQTWSSPLRVNDDNTTTDQWMPSISVDRMGRVFITWYDSRMDVTNNILTKLYGAISTNGGVSFGSNFAISDSAFNPNSMAVPQPGGENYIGDYIGCSAINRAGYAAWMDGRSSSLGSYVGYFPDFAMTINPTLVNVGNNDSTFTTIRMSGTRGTLFSAIKYTATLDSQPTSGSIQFSFVNNKDSITTAPDTVRLRIKTVGTIAPSRSYHVTVKGFGLGGTPVHVREFDLLVNASALTVGTNRGSNCTFKVNGVTYNQTVQLVFVNGSSVQVQAISPSTVGANRYVYTHWSDNGDTTHNVTINSNLSLTAFYKIQYQIIMNSSADHIHGAGFYDSSSNATFYVDGKYVNYNGAWFQFAGWDGSGNNSYTSPDSSGNDTAHTLQMLNPIVETPRWLVPIGINKIGTEVPTVYKLYQNYPNPFNPSTTINFDIVKSGNVSIVLYNLLGQEIKTILNADMEPGKYTVTFSADEFASGVYFYRLKTKDFTDVKKMLLVK